MKKTTDFTANVINIIKAIPRGKVMSYGQVAKLAGNPRGARAVSWILHSCTTSHRLPWHRVVNAKGAIAFPKDTPQFKRQWKLLEGEGYIKT